jgi:hypothetical protein
VRPRRARPAGALLSFAVGVVVAVAVVAIALAGGIRGVDEGCDAEDLANREAECGYYDQSGTWVLYPWVVPGVGGHAPAGQHPRRPDRVVPTPPRATGKPAVTNRVPTAPRPRRSP